LNVEKFFLAEGFNETPEQSSGEFPARAMTLNIFWGAFTVSQSIHPFLPGERVSFFRKQTSAVSIPPIRFEWAFTLNKQKASWKIEPLLPVFI
jgi:hypothetical protein